MSIVYRIDKEKGITFVLWDGMVTADQFLAQARRLTSDVNWPSSRRLHRLEHEGPHNLLLEFSKLQRRYPQAQAISNNLTYLKKRKAQMHYPQFQAQGWPIGSGILESGNKLVVEARLKGSGMHWAEEHVNPMLAIRNSLCSGCWKEDWPKIEARLRQQTQQRRRILHQARHPISPSSLIARALRGDFVGTVSEHLEIEPTPPQPRKNPGETSSMARLSTNALLHRKFKSQYWLLKLASKSCTII